MKLKSELDLIKEYGRETYAEVISRLVNRVKEDEEAGMELSKETLKGIREAREDIRKGRVLSSEKLKNDLGL